MSCSFFTRFLPLRNLRFHRQAGNQQTPTAVENLTSNTSDSSPSSRPLTSPQPTTTETDQLTLLNMMPGQGSQSLIISQIPDGILLSDCERIFQQWPGFVGVRKTAGMEPSHHYDELILDFATASDAFSSLLDNNSRTFHLAPFIDPLSEAEELAAHQSDDSTKPRKKARLEPPKMVCHICYSELDGAYLRPCLRCKMPRCYDCIERQFVAASHDHERMPARCCGSVLHPDVAQGILSPIELELYKQKLDEFSTPNPLYCPVPTCSAFLPSRTLKPVDKKVKCHICSACICMKCKQVAVEPHNCSITDSKTTILETYNYKLCPKCGTGVMRMFGCPHIRCQCGAHWCWECRRPINACYRKPCQAAREDGQHSEGEEFPDESETENDEFTGDSQPTALANLDQNTVEPSPGVVGVSQEPLAERSHERSGGGVDQHQAQPSLEAPAATDMTPPPTNDPQDTTATDPASRNPADEVDDLDDPDNYDWEGGSQDFGEEPNDESYDIWGCQHLLVEFTKDKVPDRWMLELDLGENAAVQCMQCFEMTIILEPRSGQVDNATNNEEQENTAACMPDSAKDSLVEKQTMQATKPHKAAKARREEKKPAWLCNECGVICCGPCRRVAKRRVIQEVRKAA